MSALSGIPNANASGFVHGRTDRSYHRGSVLVAWTWWILSTSALATGLIWSERNGLVAASTILVAGCGIAFFRMGAFRVTPSGVYFLSVAVLVAAPILYVGLLRRGDPIPGLFEFACAVSFSAVLTYSLRIRYSSADLGDRSTEVGQADLPAHSVQWLTRFGLACFLLAMILSVGGGEALIPATHALASIGVVSLAAVAALVFRGTATRQFVATAIAALIFFVIFVVTFFSGFGRLILVGLLLAGWMVVTTVAPRRWHKLVMVGTLLPALVIGGLIGVSRSGGEARSVSVEQVLIEERGLDSWTAPPLTAADLISRDDRDTGTAFPRLHGLTYVEAVLIPIPRTFWPDKPVGFGMRLTQVLLPAYEPYGHSMAATAFGESYANFGWLGFFIIGAIMPPVLAALDRWQLRIARSGFDPPAILRLLVFVMIVAGIPDFVWGGFASSTARAGIRVILLVGMLVVVTRTYVRPRPTHSAGSPRDARRPHVTVSVSNDPRGTTLPAG